MTSLRTDSSVSLRTSDGGLNQQAYDEIRRRILEGELLPSQPLSEHQLATTLQLGRTPVREAIKRLAKEGLVRSVPNRGTFIAELSAHDIMEIYQVRGRLESLAARIAATQMSAADIQALEQEILLTDALAAEGRVGDIFQSDIRLHKRIIVATQNSRITAILAMLDDQMYRVRAILPRSPEWLEAAQHDHHAIVACIKARDGQGAEQAMEHHLRSSCERAMRLVLPLHSG